MKKVSHILILCMIISKLSFATGGPITTASSLVYCNGGTISVPVTISDFEDVGGISITLNYDAGVLQYQGAYT